MGRRNPGCALLPALVAAALLHAAAARGDDAATARTFGAAGDGVADDTAALGKCLGASRPCVLPAGKYRVGDLAMPAGAALIGEAGLGYAGDTAATTPSRPVLIARPGAASVLKVAGASHVVLRGLFIDCAGTGASGISGGSIQIEMQRVTVTRCAFGLGGGGGDGYTHGATIINSEFASNRTGVADLIDSVMIGGAASANAGDGIALGGGANANNFVGVRSEWNGGAGLHCYQAFHLQVVGGMVDRNGVAGWLIDGCGLVTGSGVDFNRNGAKNDDAFLGNAQIVLSRSHGVVLTGATSAVGANDDGKGAVTPRFFLVSNTGPGVSSRIIITGSDVSGFTRAFSAGSVPADFVLRDNLGAPTDAEPAPRADGR